MDKEKYDIDSINNIVAPIAKAYGVERVYLFGSYATGKATPDSDIDLRIDRGRISDLFTLAVFYDELQDKLDAPVDVLTTGALDDKFLKRISEEEILLYDAS
jgi:predicted nucleotidyltransferase